MAFIHEPLKCGVCGGEIPWIPALQSAHQCSCPSCTFVGDGGGRYDYANHYCPEEARAAYAARMKNEHPEIESVARELAELAREKPAH